MKYPQFLESFSGADPLHVAVVGASGGIGGAFVDVLAQQENVGKVYAFARCPVSYKNAKIVPYQLDIEDENSIKVATDCITAPLDIVIVTTGLLHNTNGVRPEKSIKDLDARILLKVFSINTIGVALIGKYFLPLLKTQDKSVFAALSARVGSITDNKLGGWYAYRASKAALNMVLKNFAIEFSRKPHCKGPVILGLQPGTVETSLSQPFRGQVAANDLKTPHECAQVLLEVINTATTTNSGAFLDWQGKTIPY